MNARSSREILRFSLIFLRSPSGSISFEVCDDVGSCCFRVRAEAKLDEFFDIHCDIDESCFLNDLPVRLVSRAEVQEPCALLRKREEVTQETSRDAIPVDYPLGSFERP